jgi:acetylornithine deacetylase/succinyl-diaminopimelate desuccinylase-like protein
VSPFGYFTLDIRSNQAATLREYVQEARHLIEQQASKLGVSVKIIELNALIPTESLDSQLQDILAEGCKELGLSFVKMPSGALHDAAIVASRQKSDGSPIAVAMIFIPCKDGISHNPKEYTSPHAVQKGAQALAWVLYRLTSQKDRITEL